MQAPPTPKAPPKRRPLRLAILLALIVVCLPGVARLWVHLSVSNRIYRNADVVPRCDVALVLGCSVRPNGTLSTLLADRVRTAVALYRAGKVRKLLMSGDNRFVNYNEPEKMKSFAVLLGVPERDIAMDFAGRRTYDSVYRARHIFGQSRLVVVSQGFHLDRALFLCRHLGIDAYGVPGRWPGRPEDRIREVAACMGAIIDIYLRKPTPILGPRERIGNG